LPNRSTFSEENPEDETPTNMHSFLPKIIWLCNRQKVFAEKSKANWPITCVKAGASGCFNFKGFPAFT
jgi:hypothetical protein